jgi:UDP-glucuronate decarboxylase
MERNAVFGHAMRVVVTGGAGFLGSHLCARLLQRGCSVLAVDNLSTGNLRNIAPLSGHADFRFVQHDIVAPISLRADWIFNMACCASPRHYQRDPEKTMRTCTDGVLNLLAEARACHARIFQASTSGVYGEPEVHPQAESYRGSVNPDGPRACYDEGKRCAEAMFFDFHRMYGVDIKVARIFNTYGPQMQIDDGRVVSNFSV